MTRRKFLTGCGAALAVGITGGWARAAQTITGRKHWMVEELTQALFEKHIGETFTVSHAEYGSVPLKLTSVLDTGGRFPQRDGAPNIETFSVCFEGPKEKPLPQDTFAFSNPAIGAFDLFMVPVVSRDPGVRRYEIIISRLLK